MFFVIFLYLNNNVYEARFRHEGTSEMSKTLSSWGSMHASVEPEGID